MKLMQYQSHGVDLEAAQNNVETTNNCQTTESNNQRCKKTGGLQSGGLQFGGLQSRATDFGSGDPLIGLEGGKSIKGAVRK